MLSQDSPYRAPVRRVALMLIPAMLLGVASAFGPQVGPSINSFTVDGGGGTSTGGNFAVSGTAGQPEAGGALSGGTFTLVGGFWPGDVTPAPDCLADIAPPPNGDGLVNIDDLVATITSWGRCPALPATCPGDVNASGTVDIDDLVMVITGWGACP